MIDLNKRRADRAAAVLNATGYRDGVEWYSAISDCLKDLRHLADAKKLDFDAIVESSEEGYDQEIVEDSLPQQRQPSGDFGWGDESEWCEAEYEVVSVSEVDDVDRYSYDARQAKPLNEQTLDDFDDYFQNCEGLTFIYIAYDDTGNQTNTTYPDVLSAIALARDALLQADYEPPYPHSQHEATSLGAVPKAQVASGMTARVSELKRRDVKFVLIWNIAGQSSVNVAGDLCGFTDNLIDLLATEVRELLSY
jgi:hypothetical protein